MKNILVVLILGLLYGCSIGPVQVEHEHGQLPKVNLTVGPEECKIRFKHDAALYGCKWKI